MLLQKLNVHFMPGDGKGWALDEDQRQMRLALKGIVRECSLTSAEIIHTPFWQGLSSVAPEILEKTFVIANADNPPFFYLKQPDFAWGQQVVDLWIARSQEAFEQFRALKLAVEYIPYTIDPKLFFPISDKKALRRKFGIPEHAYVIANFHRDSEGSDLAKPKVQKAPEFFLAILKALRQRGVSFHVLLAGPRRHWLRGALAQEEISFTFIGKQDVVGDDFGINILKRDQLNELINAADLYLISSRWEGGPQSVMEAAACRCKILSTPLGVAKDILEPASLYRSVEEAVDQIVKDQEFKNLFSKSTEAANNCVASVFPASHEMKLGVEVEVKAAAAPKLISSTSTSNLNWREATAPSAPCSSSPSATLKADSDFLQATVEPQWEKWHATHTTATLKEELRKLYERLPSRLPQRRAKSRVMSRYRYQILHVLRRWARRLGLQSKIKSVGWHHEIGKDSDLDHLLLNVSAALCDEGVKQHPAAGYGIEIIGWPSLNLSSKSTEAANNCVTPVLAPSSINDTLSRCAPSTPCSSSASATFKKGSQLSPAKKGVKRLQWIIPQMGKEYFLPEALLVAPSVQDVLNLRAAGCFQPAVVLPWPIASAKPLSEEPLVIAQGDLFASLDVSKAMSAGRPIVYPKASAYYEQVFHSGFSFESEEELPQMIQKARKSALELRSLAKILTVKEAREQLKQLLKVV